ncbi:MAG: 30S ribosomal protein S11 [Candidatus Vogelbacteria bacterium]|nr:30S ribosomal protein S11 [Candidatus Vogelbacteria bacterium]
MAARRKLLSGLIQIQATYNNTKLSLYDLAGNLIIWVTSGSLGFAGAKKGTTFAAGKVGERLADQALDLGIKEVSVVIKGVGAGREAALRAFSVKGINIISITDATPIPFNGPKPRKPRRV